jgi:hypothetical protein
MNNIHWVSHETTLQEIEVSDSTVVILQTVILIVNMCLIFMHRTVSKQTKTKTHGLSPRANYTDRATAACQTV